jgi:putative hemolysin
VEHWIDDPLLSTGVAFLLAFAFVTYLHVTLGELVPKAIALTKNESTALWVALPIEAVYVVTYPLVWFLQQSANAFTRLFGIQPAPAGIIAHTEEDIRMIVAQAEEGGVIEEAEEEMVYKVFDFADKEVHEVMVPRPEVVALSVDLPTQECLAAVIDSPYTRYPAYRRSLDEIVGILHVRDLFSALNDRGLANVQVEELLRQPYFIPETKDLAALLADFRRTKNHMAVVVDEYGAMQGIVTLEDLIEEIVGEIEDEYDLPDESVERVDETTIRIDGTFPIDDFNEQFGTALPAEDYHTVAGFVFGALGRAAEEGDELEYDGLAFLVVDVEGSRIERLQVEFRNGRTPAEAPQPAES